jgi:hypothetical protein
MLERLSDGAAPRRFPKQRLCYFSVPVGLPFCVTRNPA